MIAKIRSAEEGLKVSFPQLSVEENEANSPAYKYGANAYYISGKFGSNISITNTGTTDPESRFSIETQAVANTILANQGSLKKTSTAYSTKYEGTELVCTVSVQIYPTFISCANITDYSKLATSVSPFANALFASVGTEYRENTVIYEPSITKVSDNYARAIVSISGYEGVGGYAGLFYSADGAKNWVFWKGAQAEIPCEEYDTYALQKSFEGDSCYDESTDTSKRIEVTLPV